MLRTTGLLLLATSWASPLRADDGATLRGSPSSMVRQNEVAKEEDYTFLRTPGQVSDFIEKGYLVPLDGNADYAVATGVSFPFARPEVHTFVRRLGAQHRDACGERLVVTSLTRPLSMQPANAHDLSVHPTGMAVDLRVAKNETCRSWLEGALLALEKEGLLDVTRERNPPHYHVAIFPHLYRAHVERLMADSARVARANERVLAAWSGSPPPVRTAVVRHASRAPEAARTESSGSGSVLGIILLALAPLGLALGLRRERKEGDEPGEDLG